MVGYILTVIIKRGSSTMPAILDLLYREYCRSRLAEMRKQLLLQPKSNGLPEANCAAGQTGGPAERNGGVHDDGPSLRGCRRAKSNRRPRFLMERGAINAAHES